MEGSHYTPTGVERPGKNDVLCGRGGGTNNHTGNIRFRQLVVGHKLRYLAATKTEKPMVAREVVIIWRSLSPPGRFLSQSTESDDQNALWHDIGDKKAREKASQCLRERSSQVKEFVEKLELQSNLMTNEENSKTFNKNGMSLTAAAITQQLLQEQQNAVLQAHLALEAPIPRIQVEAPKTPPIHSFTSSSPPINMGLEAPIPRTQMEGSQPLLNSLRSSTPPINYQNVLSTPANNNMMMNLNYNGHLVTSNTIDNMPSTCLNNAHYVQTYQAHQHQVTSNNDNSLSMKEKLEQEIALLQQQQAALEAEETFHQASSNMPHYHHSISDSISSSSNGLKIPFTDKQNRNLSKNTLTNNSTQLNPKSSTNNMTKEDYRKSVQEHLYGRNKSSKSKSSTTPKAPSSERSSSSSPNSWVNSLLADDMSMKSNEWGMKIESLQTAASSEVQSSSASPPQSTLTNSTLYQEKKPGQFADYNMKSASSIDTSFLDILIEDPCPSDTFNNSTSNSSQILMPPPSRRTSALTTTTAEVPPPLQTLNRIPASSSPLTDSKVSSTDYIFYSSSNSSSNNTSHSRQSMFQITKKQHSNSDNSASFRSSIKPSKDKSDLSMVSDISMLSETMGSLDMK